MKTLLPSWVLTISAGLLAVAISGCGQDPSGQINGTSNLEAHKKVLHRGSGGEPGTLNPALAVDTFSFEILRDLFEGLTSEAADGTITPGVASSWIVSNSGKRYEFAIRPDAKWSDGEPVRARDFVRAWQEIVDPINASPVADILRPIQFAPEILEGSMPPQQLGVRALNDTTLIVELNQPTPYFPQLLSHSATFPTRGSQLVTKQGATALISNGPYSLSLWRPGGEIRLEKNKFYWGGTSVKIDTVVYSPIANEDSEFNLYRSGELDITASVPPTALPIINRDFPTELHIAPFLGVYYYALNLHSGPLRTSAKLRQALSMAIDRETLKSSLLPFGQAPAYGFVPPGTWNFGSQSWNWKEKPTEVRHQFARDLYAEAGYSQSHPLHLRLLFNTSPSIKRMAVAVAAMWKQCLGVETELIDHEYRVFLDSRKAVDQWDVLRLGWTADFNDATNFLDTLRKSSPNNDSGYQNPEFDSVMNLAAQTIDTAKRKSLLEYAERIAIGDYPVIPIYFYTSKRLISSRVRGATSNSLNRLYSKHLDISRESN